VVLVRDAILCSKWLSDQRLPGGVKESRRAVALAKAHKAPAYLGRALVTLSAHLERYDMAAPRLQHLREARPLIEPNGDRWHIALEVNTACALAATGRLDDARGAILAAEQAAPADSAAVVHILWSAAFIAEADRFSRPARREAMRALGRAQRIALDIGHGPEALLIGLDMAEMSFRGKARDPQARARWYFRPVEQAGESDVCEIAQRLVRAARDGSLDLASIEREQKAARLLRLAV